MQVDEEAPKKLVRFSNSTKVTNKIVKSKSKRNCVNSLIETPTERPMSRVARRKLGKKAPRILTEEERSEMKAKYRERKNVVKRLMKGAGKKRREIRLEKERVEAEKRLASDAFGDEKATNFMAVDEEPKKKKQRRM
eukprot:TRINITY_DN23958_c0_g1_i1.p1 TRINITY_DN23958_c0_g1~~TRINITY_DN23958_c0_g1_i1.p1  ORF type:complete len:155 (+),score=45.20 TRINITY_DN23958_c0_g1_i1:55-465(+)